MVTLLIVGDESVNSHKPPPEEDAVLLVIIRLLNVGDEELLDIPPPRVPRTVLPEKLVFPDLLAFPPVIVTPSSTAAEVSPSEIKTW
jgi:hypothetical protein